MGTITHEARGTLRSSAAPGAAIPRNFVILLVPGFSMMSLASALEPLRACNRLERQELYGWQIASIDGTPVSASNGIPFPTIPYRHALEKAGCLLVCSGLSIPQKGERSYLRALREAAASELSLGALSTGSYLLARAGLLSGYRCTIHWESRRAFQEEFPSLRCTGSIYEIDRDRLTCAGGTAALDMMLQLIAQNQGSRCARDIANQFHHQHIRDAGENQSDGRHEVLAHLPDRLRRAINLMQAHIEPAISLSSLAKQVGVGARQLQRLFVRHTAMSPLRYYLRLRIERGRELLIYSERPVIDIALACGFSSTRSFSHCYRRLQGINPAEVRAPRRAAR